MSFVNICPINSVLPELKCRDKKPTGPLARSARCRGYGLLNGALGVKHPLLEKINWISNRLT